jgi:membrane-associated phospholipid phosphatase
MGHDLGVTALLRQTFPEPVVVPFVLVTLLGGLAFYFLALTTAYTFGEHLRSGRSRRSVAYLVGLALGAAALTTALKGLIAHPRPPTATVAAGAELIPGAVRPLYVRAATAEGFALPSGHALGSTVIYGGAATALAVGTPRNRYLAAGVLVALVSLSRVVIGVHYLGDVLAGVAIGAGYLLVVDRLADRGRLPRQAFSVAALVAVLAVLVEGPGAEPLTVLGAALGGRAAWGVFGEELGSLALGRVASVATLAVALPVFGGVFGVTYGLEPAAPLAFLGGAVSVGGILLSPLLVDRAHGALG